MEEDKPFGKIRVNKNFTQNHFRTTFSTVQEEEHDIIGGKKLDESEVTKQYQEEPFRPRDIENALKVKNNRSSTGPKGIGYSVLKNFSTVKHVIATIFTKLMVAADPPKFGESFG